MKHGCAASPLCGIMGYKRSLEVDMSLREQTSQARPKGLAREDLLAVVPVHDHEGHPYYVDLADIPQPWREQFWNALYGSQCRCFEGVERAAYAWDWRQWVAGTWWRREFGPQGRADFIVMDALHRLADYPMLHVLARERTQAIRLDGRACRYIYEAAVTVIDWDVVSARELAFMRLLGIKMPDVMDDS